MFSDAFWNAFADALCNVKNWGKIMINFFKNSTFIFWYILLTKIVYLPDMRTNTIHMIPTRLFIMSLWRHVRLMSPCKASTSLKKKTKNSKISLKIPQLVSKFNKYEFFVYLINFRIFEKMHCVVHFAMQISQLLIFLHGMQSIDHFDVRQTSIKRIWEYWVWNRYLEKSGMMELRPRNECQYP